jgi:hypothetical protein
MNTGAIGCGEVDYIESSQESSNTAFCVGDLALYF